MHMQGHTEGVEEGQWWQGEVKVKKEVDEEEFFVRTMEISF